MNILLVEDSDEHAELVSFALRPFVERIQRVNDGQKAVELLLGTPAPGFDLVLLDINMPKMDGISVLREVKAHPAGRQVPMVMLTTSASPRDRYLAYHHHANAYLVKPTEFAELELLLKDVANFWGRWNQIPDPADSPS